MANMKIDLVLSCSSGRLSEDAVEQRRQRHIDDEKFIQASAVSEICLSLPQAKPMKIEPEIRQRKIENVDHSGSGSSGNAQLVHRELGAALCIPLNGRPAFWKDPELHEAAAPILSALSPSARLRRCANCRCELERMIHFVPPHIEKVRAKVPELVAAGRCGARQPGRRHSGRRQGGGARAASSRWPRRSISAPTGLWTRINALNSPWALDDVTEIVGAVGNKLDVIMLPKVDGPWDIHYLDQLLAQLEARASAARSRS